MNNQTMRRKIDTNRIWHRRSTFLEICDQTGGDYEHESILFFGFSVLKESFNREFIRGSSGLPSLVLLHPFHIRTHRVHYAILPGDFLLGIHLTRMLYVLKISHTSFDLQNMTSLCVRLKGNARRASLVRHICTSA